MEKTAEQKYIQEPYENRMKVRIDLDKYQYGIVYDALYDSDNLEDLMDAFWMGDKLIDYMHIRMKTKEGKEYLKYWAKFGGDEIISDRSYKALAIVLYLNPYDYEWRE